VAIDGTVCGPGGSCMKADTCQAGVCTAGGPLVCAPLDVCHDAGSCDPQLGACTSPPKPDGAACPGGTCQAGACVPIVDAGADGAGGAGASTGTGGSDAGGAMPIDGGALDGAQDAADPDGGDDGHGGCSCRMRGAPSGASPWLGWALLVLLRRRRAG
jgi:hypothetical protein